MPERVRIGASGSIIKNVKSVIVPHTNHLIKPGEHILEMIYAFLVGKMKRVWGYTL